MAVAMVALVSSVALASPTRGPDSRGIATERIDGAGLKLETTVAFERAVLTVTGPGRVKIQKTFGPGEAISLGLEADGKSLADGRYNYNLRLSPRSEEGSYQSGLFFIENGRAVSRHAKRSELASVRKSLNQERTRLTAKGPEAKPASGEAAVPGPQEAYTIPGPVSIVDPSRPMVTFDRYIGYPYTAAPYDRLASVYGDARGLWVKSYYVYQPYPEVGYYNYTGSIYLDANRDIDMYARYGNIDLDARYGIYMWTDYWDINMYSDGGIDMSAYWGFWAYGYWMDLVTWEGMYLRAEDGNIVQRASNGKKCCPNRPSDPTGRGYPGYGNIILLAEYDGGYFYDKGTQQGPLPYGNYGGNIYLGSFYFENYGIPVKPTEGVGYGEVYAGNINLVAGHIMNYYPAPPPANETGLYGGNTGIIRLTSLYADNYDLRPHSTPTGIYFPPGLDYTSLAVTPRGVGIGTEDPSAPLEINGEFFAAMRLYSETGGNEWALAAVPTGGLAFNMLGTGDQEVTVRRRLDIDGPTLNVEGSVRGTQFIASSSRELKTDFSTLDGKEVLSRLSEVPVMSWRYKTEDETTQHFGPVAEDFRAAFQLGDGRTISSIDADGVAMAAIQGLHELVQEQGSSLELQQVNLAKRDREIAELRETVARLEETLQQLTGEQQ
jgi:hypothetical protein